MMKEIVYRKKDFQNLEELWKNIQNAAVTINAEKRSTIKKMLHNFTEMYLNVLTKKWKSLVFICLLSFLFDFMLVRNFLKTCGVLYSI